MRERAKRIRDALQELGPTFAKMGQVLSTRPDLLPQAIIEELATLQEKVTPLTEQEVVAAMERELGVPWEDVFASIEPTPIAAGTIGQVHFATLESGERVVVKIQRPNGGAGHRARSRVAGAAGRQAAARPGSRRVLDVPLLVRQFSESLRRELGYGREAANVETHDRSAGGVHAPGRPEAQTDYSTKRLLVMERVGAPSERGAGQGGTQGGGASAARVCTTSRCSSTASIMRTRIRGISAGGTTRSHFLDMGMVGEVGPEGPRATLLPILAFSQKDARFLAEVAPLLGAGEGGAEMQDLDAFRSDLASLVEKHGAMSLKDIQLGPLLRKSPRSLSGTTSGSPPSWPWRSRRCRRCSSPPGNWIHAEPVRSGALVRHAQRAAATRRDRRSPAALLPLAKGQGPSQSDPGIGRVAGARDARRPAASAVPGIGSFRTDRSHHRPST